MDELIEYEVTHTNCRTYDVQVLRQWRVRMTGRGEHRVTCENCQSCYRYAGSALGEGYKMVFLSDASALAAARAKAEADLKQRLSQPLRVPCPECGTLQPEMSRQHGRERFWTAMQWIIVIVLFAALMAFYFWAKSIYDGAQSVPSIP